MNELKSADMELAGATLKGGTDNPDSRPVSGIHVPYPAAVLLGPAHWLSPVIRGTMDGVGSKTFELREEVGVNEAAEEAAGSDFLKGLDAFFIVKI